jgi:hypothetical protein
MTVLISHIEDDIRALDGRIRALEEMIEKLNLKIFNLEIYHDILNDKVNEHIEE